MNKVSTRARVPEVDSFSDALVRLYQTTVQTNEGIAGDAFLKGVMAEIETLSAQITTAIKQDKVKSSLDDADSVRDEAVRNLGTALDGYAALPIAAKKEAAEKLRAIFAKYGKSIASANYATESSFIESLLEDFDAADAQKAVTALDGVSELLAHIRAAENAFKKASDDYTAATSAKLDSATSLKKPLVAAVNDKLIPYLAAMAMANAAVYGDFISKVEREIDRVNATATRRASAGSAASTSSATVGAEKAGQ